MAKDPKISLSEAPGCSTDFKHISAPHSPHIIPYHRNHNANGLRSLNEAFSTVCFCCLAKDVPLTNVKKCCHKEFVNFYLSMVPSIPLLICNICHHMLKKIEDFRLQVQNNFRSLVSKREPDERCLIVNDVKKRPTVTIVSLKPTNITSKDPLSVSTAHLDVGSHAAYIDDNVETSEICNEEMIVKTEPYEASNTDTNKPNGETQFYIELTPATIKQEMPLSNNSHTPQKKLDEATTVDQNPLKKDGNELKVVRITSKESSLCPTPTKQIIERTTNKYLVNLLNSANKPLNMQEKYKTEATKEKNAVKEEPNSIKLPDIDLDECYEGKIGTVTLTEAELLKEREKERLDESFMRSSYKCESCIETFQYEVVFNKHNKRYHTKKDYPMECKFCRKRYLSYGTLDKHLEKHLVRYFCLVCNKRSNNLYALTEHYNETHTDKEPIQKKYACKECDYVTYYKVRFSNHKHRMHKMYVCKICNKKNNGYGSHKYHMKFVHDHDDDKEIKAKGFYKCDECPASYTHFGSLKAHKKTRHVTDGRPSPVYCKPCNKFLSSKFTYKQHLRHSAAHNKHGDSYLKFECDHCHEKFPLKRSLRLHIERQHLNIFNHKCNICNKLCVHDQALAKHIVTVHEKKRPPKTDVCFVCGKVYCSKEVLKKHMRIHTGERPHACDLCGMAFTQSSTLATHRKLKHKIPKKNEVIKEASASWGI